VSAFALSIGVSLMLVGILLLGLELVHPGVLLFIPGSVLIVGGFLYIFLPDVLLNSVLGTLVVLVVAVAAGLLEIPYYRYAAPTHKPMTTTVGGLVGEEGIVTVAVVPNTLRGKIRVGSEIWSVDAAQPIPAGTRVKIIRGEGVSLRVEPIEAHAPP